MFQALRFVGCAVLLFVMIVLGGCGGQGSGSQTPIQHKKAGAPTVKFTASATSVGAGGTVTLTWTTTNATSLTISPSVSEESGTLALNGSATVVVNTTTTYTATATGSGGTTTAKLKITVSASAPSVSLSVSPTSIAAGGTATLTWSSKNTTSVSINNGVGSGLGATGSTSVSPSTTTTYTATATGPGGTATATATVAVGLTVSISASPTTISPGGSTTLTWSSSGATSVTITGVSGTLAASGSTTVSPSSSTNFVATAKDASGGTSSALAMVIVNQPIGQLSAIKHIIFMLQENRSFDNYFGKLGVYRASRVAGASASDVNDLDSLPSGTTLLTAPNVPQPNYPIPPYHQRTLLTDNYPVGWDPSHFNADISNHDYLNIAGQTFKMDHFLMDTGPTTGDPSGTRPMGYYDQTDLPYYYELATQFAISDAFHSPLLSQTNPNRMYSFAATSIGRCDADPAGHPLWPARTIFEELQDAKIPWRYYYSAGVFLAQFQAWNRTDIQNQVWNVSNLFTLLASPDADTNLPAVIFIESDHVTDEHPKNDIQAGAVYMKKIFDALMASSAWKDSVFIFSYDESGGAYDHVPPFQVVPPDDILPNCADKTPGRFDLSGFRVPLIVISPYSKPHYVSHTKMETTSILKFIETRFNLPPLTRRDAAAPDMTEFLDLSAPHWLTPPSLPAQVDECVTNKARCDKSIEAYPNLP